MVEAGEKLEPTTDSASGSPAVFSSIPGTANPILRALEESLCEGRKRGVRPWPDIPGYACFNICITNSIKQSNWLLNPEFLWTSCYFFQASPQLYLFSLRQFKSQNNVNIPTLIIFWFNNKQLILTLWSTLAKYIASRLKSVSILYLLKLQGVVWLQ